MLSSTLSPFLISLPSAQEDIYIGNGGWKIGCGKDEAFLNDIVNEQKQKIKQKLDERKIWKTRNKRKEIEKRRNGVRVIRVMRETESEYQNAGNVEKREFQRD